MSFEQPLPKSLSPSRLADFKACPRRYQHASIERISQPATYATAKGRFAHFVFEHLFLLPSEERTLEKARALVDPAIDAILTDAVRTEIAMDAAMLERLIDETQEIISTYFEMEDPREVNAEGIELRLGVNVDDLGDHRPGQVVAAERGARFPLVEAGLTKAQIREASRLRGLVTADKPATPCLASRLPYGTPVTLGALKSVAEAEARIRELGFGELRVRHHGTVALVEVPADQLDAALRARAEIVEACRAAGYAFSALDLEGLSSGRLNRVLG